MGHQLACLRLVHNDCIDNTINIYNVVLRRKFSDCYMEYFKHAGQAGYRQARHLLSPLSLLIHTCNLSHNNILMSPSFA